MENIIESEEDQSSSTSELDHRPPLQIRQSLQEIGQGSTGSVIPLTSGPSKSGSNSKGSIFSSKSASNSLPMPHNGAGSSPTGKESDSTSVQCNFNKLTNTHNTARRMAGISMTPFGSSNDSGMSTSSSEDSINEFTRGGSYVLRKKGKKIITSHPRADDHFQAGKKTKLSITPHHSIDGLNMSVSSSEESLTGSFERGGTHKSFVIKKAMIREHTIITNQAAVDSQPLEYSREEEDEDIDEQLDDLLEGAIKNRIKDRVKNALKVALDELDQWDEPKKQSEKSKCFSCFKSAAEPPIPQELEPFKRVGFKMSPFFFFPSLPKVLQDLWVALELIITFFGFVFVCITFNVDVTNIITLVLSFINLALASIDGFIYFVEGGSCVECFKWGRKKLRHKFSSSKEANERGASKKKKASKSPCTFLPDRFKKMISTGSEMVRIGLTELLLYPLAVLDVLELVGSETYRVNDSINKINFSLFNIGFFYLLLTVYFIRLFMAVSCVVSMSGIPKTTASNYASLFKKFTMHLVGQIIASIVILVMVSTKIDDEHCVSSEGSAGNATSPSSAISPFLYVTIFTGEIIPFFGVIMFFVVNYPALKEFSMGFCIDMMSTIIAEDFADTAFKGKGIKETKSKVKEAGEKIDLVAARQQYSAYYSDLFSFKRKLGYRLTTPLVVLLSLIYFALISIFLICHSLGWTDVCDSDSGVQFITFSDNKGTFITLVLGLIIFTLANYQIILISMIWMSAVCGLILFIALLPIVAIVLLPFLIALLLYTAFV